MKGKPTWNGGAITRRWNLSQETSSTTIHYTLCGFARQPALREMTV